MNQVQFNEFVLRKLEETGNIDLYVVQQLADVRAQLADLQNALLVTRRAAERDEAGIHTLLSALIDASDTTGVEVRNRISERLHARILNEGDNGDVCDNVGLALRLLERL